MQDISAVCMESSIFRPVPLQGSQGLDCALLAPRTSLCQIAWLFIHANPAAGDLVLVQRVREVELRVAAVKRPSMRHKAAWTEASQDLDADGEQPCVS